MEMARGMEPGLGATRDEIRQLLGEPHDTGGTSRRHPTPSIWKYEEIEYHFGLDGRVCLIYTEDSDGEPHVIAERKDEGRTK
jgi:hypothetical protein